MFNCFKKKINPPTSYYSPIESLRWSETNVYDKDGKDSKPVKTQRVLQYQRVDGSWEDVWTIYNSPIYLEGSK